MDRLTDMVDTMIENGEIVPNDKPEFEGEDEWLSKLKNYLVKNVEATI